MPALWENVQEDGTNGVRRSTWRMLFYGSYPRYLIQSGLFILNRTFCSKEPHYLNSRSEIEKLLHLLITSVTFK